MGIHFVLGEKINQWWAKFHSADDRYFNLDQLLRNMFQKTRAAVEF